MHKEAVISDDQKYRYTLYREWEEDPFAGIRVLNFVMLNPSTADADKDDPTIRKCIGFAKLNEYNAIRVVNLFALRSTDPDNLKYNHDRGDDIVGPLNNGYVWELPPEETVVAAWGSTFKREKWFQKRVEETKNLLNRKLWCVKYTDDGLRDPSQRRPWHPLYVPYGPLIEF
jgi:hypothetical protein